MMQILLRYAKGTLEVLTLSCFANTEPIKGHAAFQRLKILNINVLVLLGRSGIVEGKELAKRMPRSLEQFILRDEGSVVPEVFKKFFDMLGSFVQSKQAHFPIFGVFDLYLYDDLDEEGKDDVFLEYHALVDELEVVCEAERVTLKTIFSSSTTFGTYPGWWWWECLKVTGW